MNVVIIGSGIAGLAVAVRLRLKGHEVDVFEKNSYPGGKLSAFEIQSKSNPHNIYRFDAGPSLFTMPHYVDELFKLANETTENYFKYIKVEDVCHYFWQDGVSAVAWSEHDKFAEEFSQKLGIEKKVILKILEEAKIKYDLSGKIFLEHSLHRFKTWFNSDVLKALFRISRLGVLNSMHSEHERLSEHTPKLTQFLDRFATYNGSNPYKASGILSMIPHFEHGFGTFYPEGGMHNITLAIFKLGEKLGVNYHFNQRVTDIIVERKKIIGIETSDSNALRKFDAVVSNMDIYYTYNQLLKDKTGAQKVKSQERSSSALIFYWGINRTFEQLGLHNIFFSKIYKTEFEALSEGKISSDPTIYINITSKQTPDDAPKNSENWFVMINAPFDDGQDWENIKTELRKNVIAKLSKALSCNLEAHIDAEQILLPTDIENKTASYKGALYGTSSNTMTSAFMRHPNFSGRIKSLYFCGGSVHPGGGIPLCLLSAKIVADIFEEN